MNLNIFCTKIKIVNDFLSEEELKQALNLIPKTKQTSHGEFVGEHSSSHYSYDNLLENTDLEKKINKEILKYCADCLIDSQQITNSWINIQKKDSILKMHNHHPVQVSGAIWLKSDKHSTDLVFENPNPFVRNTFKAESNEWSYSQYFTVKPLPGTLVLFPGWLVHGSNYEKNKSDERIVLSFNC